MVVKRFKLCRGWLLLVGFLLCSAYVSGNEMASTQSPSTDEDASGATPKEMDEGSTVSPPSEETTMTPMEGVDKTPSVPEEGPKKSVKNFTCQVTGALISMANSIKELDNDIKAIKNQMFEKCPGFNDTADSDSLDSIDDSLGALNSTSDETELEGDQKEGKTNLAGPTTTPLPPIPTECDEPFQPVASSCYYFLYYPKDWKTWGDANSYCQTLGGTLAAPYRLEDLRNYLKENFSNVFWVGAKKSTTKKNTFEWLNGKELQPEDWKEGQPSKAAAKFCVYLEYFPGYKAINHYCGEKFSFVCEKRDDMKE